MRRRTKKLLLRLIPITIILIGVITGFMLEYFLRIPNKWYTGNPLGDYEDYGSANTSFNVDTLNSLVYMSSGNSCLVIDVSDPYNPSLLADYDKGSPVEQIARQGDLLALSGEKEVNLVNISNPSSPTNISVFQVHENYTVEDIALNGDAILVAVHPEDIYVEPDLHFKVLFSFNISNPEIPSELDQYQRYGFLTYSMNLHQNIAYITYPTSGIVLVNVTDPTNLRVLGVLDGFGLVPTLPYAVNARQTEIVHKTIATYIIIADYDNGYIVADVSDPTNPLTGDGKILADCVSVDVTYDFSYIIQENGTVIIFSMEKPLDLRIFGRFDAYGDEGHIARDIHVHQATNRMYILHNHGLEILQIIEGVHNLYYQQETKPGTLILAIAVSFVVCGSLIVVVILRHRDKNAYTSRF